MHANNTPSLAIEHINRAAEIRVFPNPSKDLVHIAGLTATDKVVLYDLAGRALNQNWTLTGQATTTFRYHNVSAGAYILVITDAEGNVKGRVPVTKL